LDTKGNIHYDSGGDQSRAKTNVKKKKVSVLSDEGLMVTTKRRRRKKGQVCQVAGKMT